MPALKPNSDLAHLVNPRTPQFHRFADDGVTPNNPRLPLIHYRDVLREDATLDRARLCETLFVAHGWTESWRNGIHGFLHFHTSTHEVLGIARGEAKVQFGGDRGEVLNARSGDVIVLPAGTGHRRLSASADLLVVGAYPDNSSFDQARPDEIDADKARSRIASVALPAQDPVYGRHGPLIDAWGSRG